MKRKIVLTITGDLLQLSFISLKEKKDKNVAGNRGVDRVLKQKVVLPTGGTRCSYFVYLRQS